MVYMLIREQDERWSFGDNGMTAHARSLGGIGTDMAPVSVLLPVFSCFARLPAPVSGEVVTCSFVL